MSILGADPQLSASAPLPIAGGDGAVHRNPLGDEEFLRRPHRPLGSRSTVLHERLIAARSAAERVALLESFLLHRRQLHVISPHNGVMAVLGAIEEDPSMRVSDARELAGLSPEAADGGIPRRGRSCAQGLPDGCAGCRPR